MPKKSVRFPFPDLDDLLRRTREGDRPAREELFTQLRVELKQRARLRIGAQRPGGMDGSDLADGALEHFLKRFEEFLGQSSGELRRYLFCTLDNYIQESHRHANRHKRSARRTVSLDELGSGPEAKPSLNTVVSDKQNRQWLWAKLAGLPEAHRQAVFYRHEGWPVARIARELDRSEKAVTSLLERVVRSLRIDLRGLRDNPEHEDAPLQGALLRYLHLLERDQATDREDFLAQYQGQPGMEGLRELLEGLDWLEEQLCAAERERN